MTTDIQKENVTLTYQEANDQAQRNITIIRKKDTTKGFNVYVRNTSNISSPYTLELVPQTASDALLFQKQKLKWK